MTTYAEIVGQQAIEFECRMHEAGASFTAEPVPAGWRVTLLVPGRPALQCVAPKMATALWVCGRGAGFTEGLNPP